MPHPEVAVKKGPAEFQATFFFGNQIEPKQVEDSVFIIIFGVLCHGVFGGRVRVLPFHSSQQSY